MLALKATAKTWITLSNAKKGSSSQLDCLPEGHHATDRWCPWHSHKM
jgi:hypothetical protein